VFVLADGAVRVLDFGIARLLELSQKSGATASGAILGTPSFMPPEQARSKWDQVDAQSDVWAAGATFYALVTNRLVHGELESVTEALLAAVSQPARPMAELAPGLPSAVASVIDRALSFDKAARWPSARAMKGALLAAFASPESRESRIVATDAPDAPVAPVAIASPPASATHASVRRARAVRIFALACAGGIAVGLVAFGRRGASPSPVRADVAEAQAAPHAPSPEPSAAAGVVVDPPAPLASTGPEARPAPSASPSLSVPASASHGASRPARSPSMLDMGRH
jgi:serine/threonine-protein kinase